MVQDHDESQSMAESLPDAPAAAPVKQSYRSFKKKYAKLKVKFELGMRESESLIREELRIEDLSKRIQEQNDQLLEVLLEFNDSLHIPPNFRYDLAAPGDESFLPTPERDLSLAHQDAEVARSVLKEAKSGMAAGHIAPEKYRTLEETARRSAFAPNMQYTSLSKVPHTAPRPDRPNGQAQTEEAAFEHNLGFLTPEHETEYYLALDAKLGDGSAALQLNRAPERPTFADREKDASLRNPVSVYNWLRRNQPQIFLQDNENASEKSGSRPSNLRASKRASTNQPRKDEDTYDEDGILVENGPTPGSTKGKRKRDEDAGYRPKGGGSRSNRKKKDDGSSSSRRASKRSSGVGA